MQGMSNSTHPTFDDACYLALKARDARFDGCFFTGVTSTGIYCRPVCRVRTPKRENCRFFHHAAQAEQAGFRPCLRCRPELAPTTQAGAVPAWSMQDASRILALQAARLMDTPADNTAASGQVATLAQRLGISERHLRRIFEAQFGVPPLQYLQTRRLLCAKQLLSDTQLPAARVAHMSGFASVRRFNAAFVGHYGLSPTQLRRTGTVAVQSDRPASIQIRLAYRPPYDISAMLQFLQTRQIAGVEQVTQTPEQQSMARTLRVSQGQQVFTGWLMACFDQAHCRVTLTVSDGLATVLPQVMAAVRRLLDLDADPAAINHVLHDAFPNADGLRLPGTVDGFELAVRAVLGQQISVAAACTLCDRLVARFGEPVNTPVTGLNRLFPSATTLAAASGDALGQLGIVRQRQAAIQSLAKAVAERGLPLHAGADLAQTQAALLALPGIGDWTTQYISMRALGWPDALVAGDVALQKALGVRDQPQPARAAQAASQAWQPWRSYAVIRAWAGLPTAVQAKSTPRSLSL